MSQLKKITNKAALQAVALIAGIAMMTIGLLRGEALEILRKATVVCMECIGIG